uniref:Uncharacterized protein n=1 Tax=Rhizophora mucronata TaxID=61149 RepID=A0A2P2R1C8_RHIMU
MMFRFILRDCLDFSSRSILEIQDISYAMRCQDNWM